MQKIKKCKASVSRNPDNTSRRTAHEEWDDFDDKSYNSKKKVSCICPKCGEHHVMAFHWIGRGTPRKYCQACKSGSG